MEYDPKFFTGMKNRMLMSYHKYGPVAENAPNCDVMKEVQTRWKKYQSTGNTEWLIDAANFIMIEFMYPKHPKAHFRATDSHESPGVSTLTVKEIEQLNKENHF